MPDSEAKIVQVVIAGTALMAVLGISLLYFVLDYKKRKKKHLDEKIIMQHRFQQELLQAQLEIQEQTLQNISQEIHDNIGQTLSLAKLHLGTIDAAKPEASGQKIMHSKELVGKAIQDLRSLSRTLHADAVLSAGLVRSIESELGIMERSGVYHTTLDVQGEPVKLEAQKELILFRIVQEALNNIIKHAGASEVSVTAAYGPELQLTIRDNGRGFGEVNQGDGSGLRNMQNRAALIGGTLSITSKDTGTTILLTVPTPSL